MTALLNGIALGWWDWMAAMLWQASLLIVFVSAVDLLIGRWAWPQVRHALWLLVLLKLLLPPTWSLPTGVVARLAPAAREGIVSLLRSDPAPLPASSPTVAPAAAVTGETSEAAAVASPRPPAPREPDPAGGTLVWQAWALGVWLLGIAAIAALLAFRIATLRRWHREQQERKTIPPWFHELLVRTAQKVGLERLPAIVFSKDAVAPAVYGVFRPVLLLPAGYTDSLSPEDAEHVLLHELAHIRRGDLWLHGIALLLQIVYWFNPLLLAVTRQLKHVRELCCDLTIANLLREKTMKYRQTLLETARALLTESLEPGMGLLGVFEEPFRLVSRLRWLERETWRTRVPARAASGCVAALGILFILPMSSGGAGSLLPTAASAGLTAATAVSGPGSELFLREETWTTVRCFGIEAHSELRGFSKTWIGPRRAATIEDGKTIVVDLDRNVVRFVNHRNRSYVEAPRPFDVIRHLPEEAHGDHPYTRSTGDVEVSPGAVRYLGRKCREYAVRLWDAGGGRGRPPLDLTVWATTDVSGDLRAFHELIHDRRVFQNRDAVALRELDEIQGIQMGVENVTGPIWWRVSRASQIVDLERQDPPADVYSIPPGYAKKDRFTPDDF